MEIVMLLLGPPWWLNGKESNCQCWRRRRREFDPWVGKITWRRKWQLTPVFLPGESHGLQHNRLPCPSPTPGACSELMSTESVMPSNHLILRHPLLLPPSIFPSIRVFSKGSVLRIRWPKYWVSASLPLLPKNIQD